MRRIRGGRAIDASVRGERSCIAVLLGCFCIFLFLGGEHTHDGIGIGKLLKARHFT